MAAFPLEIWICIVDFCDHASLPSLLLVSRGISAIVRPRLFGTVTCIDDTGAMAPRDFDVFWTDAVRLPGSGGLLSEDAGTVLRSSTLTGRHAASVDDILVRPPWREHLRRAFFVSQSEALPWSYCKAIAAVSQLERLEFLHVSLPASFCELDFDTSRITSLTTSPTGDRYGEDPDFEGLFAIFQLPSLRTLYLDTMRHLEAEIPVAYRQPGCSSVTSLTFINCGYPTENLRPLLQWPKQLHRLAMDVRVHADSSMRFCHGRRSGCVFRATEPLKSSLEELEYREWKVDGLPFVGNAFLEYSALKRLNISLRMFFEKDYLKPGNSGGAVSNASSSLPVHMLFPSSLEMVHFRFADTEFPWARLVLHQDEESIRLRRGVEEVLEWLSGFAHQVDHFPRLRKIRLDHGHQLQTRCHPPQPCCPYYHDLTARTQQQLAEAGITMVFDGP